MEAFEYQLPTKIVFGVGRYAETGRALRGHWQKGAAALWRRLDQEERVYDRVKKSLADAGCSVVELGGVQPNPRLALVREGICAVQTRGAWR